MPIYVYKGRNHRGESVSGSVDADTADIVATQLFQSEVTPISISEGKRQESSVTAALDNLLQKNVSLEELSLFARQMYTLIHAGIPIVRSLKTQIDTCRNKALQNALKEIILDIESGVAMGPAINRHPTIFMPLVANIISIGETTGRLDEAFLQLAEYLELEQKNKAQIKSALRYPMIVIIVMGLAFAIINIFVIPAFSKIFEAQSVELPWATIMLLAISHFFVNWWPQLLGTLILAFLGTRSWVNTEHGKMVWGKWKLKIPVFGDIINRATLGRFTRSLSLATASGVPIIQSITVVSGSLDNAYLQDRMSAIRTGIENGESLTLAATISGLFPPLVLQMIAVGEETGQLDKMLRENAAFYEREVEYDLKKINDVIEPMMIIGIGIMVLVLALGIFLPMWDLNSTIMG